MKNCGCASDFRILIKISVFHFSFFLSFPVFSLLPTHCICTWLLVHLITLNDTHTHTHTLTVTALDEGSDRRRHLYLTTYNTHHRQTSMSAAGFESAIPTSERSQTHALDRAAIGNGFFSSHIIKYKLLPPISTKLYLQDYNKSRR